jgi:hypothetical protein
MTKNLREQRRKGAIWLALALVCFGIATPFAIAIFAAIDEGGRGRGFIRAVANTGSLPILLVGAGLWLLVRSLRLLFSQRYSADV